ncbi:hypothetical protein ABIA33_001420 [Streptacidiphilus sp. MAP12-16]|uniref:hypothetical protein n=1 Tax=Streptacidiphilus sp. MAP12-16 TaxID=3156300 RepID=UPI003512B949
MALVVVGSAKGGTAATTVALGLAGAAAVRGGPEVVLLEADSSGGDLELDFDVPAASGLVALAAAARRGGMTSVLLRAHAQLLSSGVRAVHAPVAFGQARTALEALEPLWRADQFEDLLVVADVGALTTSRATELVSLADVVVLASGGSRVQLTHTADAIGVILAPTVAVAVTGECAYGPEEIVAHLDATDCALLPHDPLSAAVLRGARVPKRAGQWRRAAARFPLLHAVSELGTRLESHLPASKVPDPDPAGTAWPARTGAGPEPLASALAALEH